MPKRAADVPPASRSVRRPLQVRPAGPADLDRLAALETLAFATDRLTRRRFARVMAHGNSLCLACERGDRVVGYALVLFRRGSRLARLYSLAVDPESRGLGVGAALLTECEIAAMSRGTAAMRLEVRPDNEAALALYRRFGYREFARRLDYYEDHSPAIRLEKQLLVDRSGP